MLFEQANRTEAPHAGAHGYKTIGDISCGQLNFLLEASFTARRSQVSRYTREMVLA